MSRLLRASSSASRLTSAIQGTARQTAVLSSTTASVPKVAQIAPTPLVRRTEASMLPSGASPSLSTSLTGTRQIRLVHTDLKVPDFSAYTHERRGELKGDPTRRAFSYVMIGGAGVLAASTAKSLVMGFVKTMSASQDVLAMSKAEIDLTKIDEGKNLVMKWRGKPLFVRHRTSAEIQAARKVDKNSLRDPESDDMRIKGDAKWLVVLGVCTHLGCVPISHEGDYGGYFCPCHGSHYDTSGRIRKGPAPLNLEVPEYTFIDDGAKMLVG